MRLQGGNYSRKTGNPQRGTFTNPVQYGPGGVNDRADKQLQRGRNPMTLTPQQIRAIKNSAKGVLPAFIKKAARKMGEKGVMTDADVARRKKK